MKDKKILFVGGPSDGHRKIDPRTNNCPVLHTFVPNPDWLSASHDMDVGVQTHTYYIKKFRSGNKEYEVAFDSSVNDPMEALIKGYRYHRSPKKLTFKKVRDHLAPRYMVTPSGYKRV